MEGEPDKWFARFLTFLQLGARRSLRLAQIAAESGQKESRKARKWAANSWVEACEKWNWHDRAHKWDVAQAQKGLQTLEADMEEQKRSTVRVFRKIAQMADHCLDAKSLEECKLELGKLMALCRKSGAIDAIATGHKASFGAKHQIENTDVMELDFDLPFERFDKKAR